VTLGVESASNGN